MTSDSDSPEDVIRQGGRIGDSRRRAQDDLERWSRDVMASVGKWSTELQAAVTTALATQADMVLTLEARVHEVTTWREGFEVYMGQFFTKNGGEILELQNRVSDLEAQARSRDDYEAEMRDRG